MTSPGVLELDRVGMSFDGRPVLEGLSLAFEPGAVHGLIGHNGSGKSTLIRILAGYHRPTMGTVRLGGEPVVPGSPHRCHLLGLRFVHQDLGLVPEFDALENFGLGADYSRRRWRTLDWAGQRRRLHAALAMLDCEIPERKPASSYSAVQRALLAIARAIAPGVDGSTARYLTLDEPTTALEEPETEQLFGVLRRLTSQGVGILYVSHHLDEVLDLCDRVSSLRDGRLVCTVDTTGATRQTLVASMFGSGGAPGATPFHAGPAGSPPSPAPAGPATPPPRGVLERPGELAAGTGRPSAAPPVLAVRGLTSASLHDVDLDLYRGECVCAVGLSGSGREELVYALAGAVPVEVTSVVVDGEAIPSLDPVTCRRRRVAVVPGNRLPGGMVADFSIRENLSFASLEAVTGPTSIVDRGRERALARGWMEEFDVLPRDPDYLCRHLSGGNKQKVILAKWLGIDPHAMLIDEPTAGVDVGAVSAILATLRSAVDRGMAVLISTSEVSEVLDIADRVVVLRRGRLVAELTREEGQWSEQSIVHAMTGAAA